MLDKDLQESHIIPKFVYKPLRDDKNRMYQLFLSDDHDKKSKKHKLIQDGLKEHLLCFDCEQLLNDKYEKYFKTAWLDENKLPETMNGEGIKITGLDYSKFKLFHLSILFRASVSSLPEFKNINLGHDEDVLRGVLLNGVYLPETKYPIICNAITKGNNQVHFELITSPRKSCLPGGYISYYFCFAGCVCYYIVDDCEVSYFSDFMLRSNGELKVNTMFSADF
jgi:hypothetical protein